MSSITLEPLHDFGVKFLMHNMHVKLQQPSPSLLGKTAIITGGNSGIGAACARILPTLHISHLILAVRSIDSGEKLAATLRGAHPDTRIEVWTLDMQSYDSIQSFAKRCNDLKRLDIAILNAGMVNTGFKINASTGHEETFQCNYLSTALLSILLLPTLKYKSPPSSPGRLTIVGSALGMTSKFPNRNAVPLIPSFDDGNEWNGMASAMERYNVTKTLLFMLTLKLGESVSADDVIVNVVEPGFTGGTKLQRDANLALRAIMPIVHKLTARTPDQAAWTYVDAAVVKGKESHGSFVMNWVLYP